MKKLLIMLMLLLASATGIRANATYSEHEFEKAVEMIKKYETLHSSAHWPLVGYGHKVQPGEKFKKGHTLTEAQADALLRKDLKKFADLYKSFGKDSLLLGVLAYNIGPGRVNNSTVLRLLKQGNRNIRDAYTALCRYKGKIHKQIQSRRIEELRTLFKH